MINKVTLLGRLGQDSKLVKSKDGKNILYFSVATSEKFKKDNQWKEMTEWHEVMQFDPMATTLQSMLVKGKLVYIEGKLNTFKSEKDGKSFYRTKIISSVIKICDPQKEERSVPHASTNSLNSSSSSDSNYGTTPFNFFEDSEIPF